MKKASEIIKNAIEQFKMVINKVFPKPAIANLWLQLQMADNTRMNKYLVGWNRLIEGV